MGAAAWMLQPSCCRRKRQGRQAGEARGSPHLHPSSGPIPLHPPSEASSAVRKGPFLVYKSVGGLL